MGSMMNCSEVCSKDYNKNQEMNVPLSDITDMLNNNLLMTKNSEKITSILTKGFSISIPKQVLIKDYYRGQNFHKSSKEMLKEDVLFLPEKRNISSIDEEKRAFISENEIKILFSYKFLKLSQIYSLDFVDQTFYNDFIKNKIYFGELANINLVNSLLLLGSFKPIMVNKIKVLSKSLFLVRLIIHGIIKWIVVDENIPVNENNCVPAFTYPEKPELAWVVLIEKAIAKVKNSYGNIIKDLASDFIELLIEVPLIPYPHIKVDKKEIWNLFTKARKNNWLIFSEFNKSKECSYSWLSYFVISVFQYSEYKFVKLFIPNFNDEDKIKQINLIFNTEQSKKIINETKTDTYYNERERSIKSLFVVDFDVFFKQLSTTYFVKYNEGYSYSNKRYMIDDRDYKISKLKVTKTSKVTLIMHIKKNKGLNCLEKEIPISRIIIARLNKISREYEIINSKSRNDYDYDQLNITLKSKDYSFSNNKNRHINSFHDTNTVFNLNFVESSYGKKEKHLLELELEEGIYLVFFKVLINSPLKTVITLYSDCELKLEENFEYDELFLLNNENEFSSNINSLFNSYLSSKGLLEHIESKEFTMTNSFVDNKLGFSVVKFENLSNNKILNVKLGYELTGMKLISHLNLRTSLTNVQEMESDSTNRNMINYEKVSIQPSEMEIFIFEWEKEINETHISIYPKYFIDNEKIDTQTIKEFDNLAKKVINKDIYYYEIPFKNKIYLVFVNNSKLTNYKLTVIFRSLCNLNLKKLKTTDNKLDLSILAGSKEILNLGIINPKQEISYKLKFEVHKL